MRYSQFLEVAAVRHRTLSYNKLAPKTTQRPGKINVTATEAWELIKPYCGIRILEQLKAVVPLAAYLMLFQLLVLRYPVESAVSLCLGLVAVIIGLAIFMEGLSTGLMPFGNLIGDNLPKKARMSVDRKSTRLNSSHSQQSRMPSSA